MVNGDSPIGVFDSGLGGISVVRQIRRDLPGEDVIFYGDSANAPYGTKSVDEVREYSMRICDHLMERGAKAIVVACNTATSACVDDLRATYPVPVIGMEPALKVACDAGHGRPQTVIVAATPLTLRERKFARLMERFTDVHRIYKQPCPDLVTIVESGRLSDRGLVMGTLHKYFDAYDLGATDSIVLGCTHFIFYRDYFREFMPANVAIIDGNHGTASHLRDVLAEKGILASGDATLASGAPRMGRITLENSSPDPALMARERSLLENGM